VLGKPVIAESSAASDVKNGAHDTVNGQNIKKSRKHSTDRTIALCPLSVDNVRPDLSELTPNSTNAAKVACLQPTPAWDKNGMVRHISGKLCDWMLHPHGIAGNNVKLKERTRTA
jgi:hypothetical protein